MERNNNNTDDTIINFTDPVLEKGIRKELNKRDGDIYKSDLLKLTQLIIYGGDTEAEKISNLSGVEYCKNIETLILSNHNISNLNNIIGLIKMKKLILNNNKIDSIDIPMFGNVILDHEANRKTELEIDLTNNNIDFNKKNNFLTLCFLLYRQIDIKFKNGNILPPPIEKDIMNYTQDNKIAFENYCKKHNHPKSRLYIITHPIEKNISDNKIVQFKDSSFERVIRKYIEKPLGKKIYFSDVKSIKELVLENKNDGKNTILNLDGIEYFINLETLIIKNQKNINIGKIASLTKLKKIIINNCIAPNENQSSKLVALFFLCIARYNNKINHLLEVDITNNNINFCYAGAGNKSLLRDIIGNGIKVKWKEGNITN